MLSESGPAASERAGINVAGQDGCIDIRIRGWIINGDFHVSTAAVEVLVSRDTSDHEIAAALMNNEVRRSGYFDCCVEIGVRSVGDLDVCTGTVGSDVHLRAAGISGHGDAYVIVGSWPNVIAATVQLHADGATCSEGLIRNCCFGAGLGARDRSVSGTGKHANSSEENSESRFQFHSYVSNRYALKVFGGLKRSRLANVQEDLVFGRSLKTIDDEASAVLS